MPPRRKRKSVGPKRWTRKPVISKRRTKRHSLLQALRECSYRCSTAARDANVLIRSFEPELWTSPLARAGSSQEPLSSTDGAD